MGWGWGVVSLIVLLFEIASPPVRESWLVSVKLVEAFIWAFDELQSPFWYPELQIVRIVL